MDKKPGVYESWSKIMWIIGSWTVFLVIAMTILGQIARQGGWWS